MRFLEFKEREDAFKFFEKVVEVAEQATCNRSKCGSIIVKDGEIIGEGFNSPPANLEGQRRCLKKKNEYNFKVTDKTCCVYAEQRAIMDALKKNSEKIVGSRLYFIRLDENCEIAFAGRPYCTICSKMALDSGVKEFVLYHEEGICVYDTAEYNELSCRYN